ncbi:MAG: GPW/gp25 family protein, partial [Candidatus Dormibacteria bacterium]
MANPNLPVYSDIADSMIPHPVTGDLLLVTGVQSIVQSILNLVSMNHWDIPFHGEIGGNVRKLL